nr:MAG TPA_asm: hypothetical protein [Caudoviricetes sp.]
MPSILNSLHISSLSTSISLLDAALLILPFILNSLAESFSIYDCKSEKN